MTRVISISDDAYERLMRIKDKMSFSEVVIELTKCKKDDSIFELAGTLSEEEGERIMKNIREGRKAKSWRM